MSLSAGPLTLPPITCNTNHKHSPVLLLPALPSFPQSPPTSNGCTTAPPSPTPWPPSKPSSSATSSSTTAVPSPAPTSATATGASASPQGENTWHLSTRTRIIWVGLLGCLRWFSRSCSWWATGVWACWSEKRRIKSLLGAHKREGGREEGSIYTYVGVLVSA